MDGGGPWGRASVEESPSRNCGRKGMVGNAGDDEGAFVRDPGVQGTGGARHPAQVDRYIALPG